MGCVESSNEPPKQQARTSVKQPVRNGSSQRRQQTTGAPPKGSTTRSSRVHNGTAVPKKVTMDIGIQTEGGGFILRRLSSRIKQKRSTREQRVAEPPVDDSLLFDMHRTVTLNHSNVSLYIEQALTLPEKQGGVVRRASSKSRKTEPDVSDKQGVARRSSNKSKKVASVKVTAKKSAREEAKFVDEGHLSNKNIRLVQECWKHVQRDVASFGVEMFVRLLDKNPQLAKLFPFGKLNLPPEQLQNHPDLRAHGQRVMETIGTAVEGLEDLELIVAMLKDLGERHAIYGAKPEHFSAVAEALMYSLRNGLPPKVFNSEVQGAFGNILTIIAETMSSTMGSPSKKVTPAKVTTKKSAREEAKPVDEGPLSKREIELVQECWKRVQKDLASFGVEMFVRLLDKNPLLAKLFPFGKLNLPPEQLRNHPDLRAHGQRVMETIGTAVGGLTDLHHIVAILKDLGERHAIYGAKPEHFSAVAEALMYSLRNGLPPKVFNSEVQGAFGNILTIIDEAMSSTMGSNLDKTEPNEKDLNANEEGPISAQDKKLVQGCWKIIQKDLVNIGAAFFVRLLEQNPSIRTLFPFGKSPLPPQMLKRNPDLRAHGQNVMETIGVAVSGLDELDVVVTTLEELGVKHQMYGAKPEHFKPVVEALMFALTTSLPKNVFTSEVQESWLCVLKVVGSIMANQL